MDEKTLLQVVLKRIMRELLSRLQYVEDIPTVGGFCQRSRRCRRARGRGCRFVIPQGFCCNTGEARGRKPFPPAVNSSGSTELFSLKDPKQRKHAEQVLSEYAYLPEFDARRAETH